MFKSTAKPLARRYRLLISSLVRRDEMRTSEPPQGALKVVCVYVGMYFKLMSSVLFILQIL